MTYNIIIVNLYCDRNSHYLVHFLVIKIDLRNSKLQPGQRSFKRIKAALDSLEKFSLILSWLPPEDTICPSSVAKFFNDLNYNVKVCKNNFKTHVLYSINSPIILKEDISENEIIDFAEWLGMVSIDGDFLGSFDNYVNTYEAPEPSIVLSQLRFLQWRGFFLPEHIEKLTSFLRDYNDVEKKSWMAIYTQGFSDMPIVTPNKEHHYYTNGDNGNLLIFNKNKFLSCIQRCTSKTYK